MLFIQIGALNKEGNTIKNTTQKYYSLLLYQDTLIQQNIRFTPNILQILTQ